MNIALIIGNGFDVNLGLETSYSKFIKSNHFLSLLENDNKLCMHLYDKHELQKWIDIESELKTYSGEVFNSTDRSEFRDEYNALCDALCKYIRQIDYTGINKESDAYRRITKILKNNDNVVILNYNYTESLNLIIQEIECTTSVKEHIHVHGSAKNNNIIFGVEDQARINPNDAFLTKSYSDNFYVGVNKVLKDSNAIIIYGHSIGETDHSYFTTFFHEQNVRGVTKSKLIGITYYGEKGKDEIFKQLRTLTHNNISGFKELNNFEVIPL